MDVFLIILLGLLAVMAIPGFVLLVADLLGPVETRHISRHDVDFGVDIDTTESLLTRTGPHGLES